MTLTELYDDYLVNPPTDHQFANPETLEFRFGNFKGKEFRSVPDSYLLSLINWDITFPKTRRDICDVLIARHFPDFWKYADNNYEIKNWLNNLCLPWTQLRGRKLVSLTSGQVKALLDTPNLNCYFRKLIEVVERIQIRKEVEKELSTLS